MTRGKKGKLSGSSLAGRLWFPRGPGYPECPCWTLSSGLWRCRLTQEVCSLLLASAQLLGDYDKVKAVSEGSDCRCKCLVRPLGRGACQRINEGAFRAEDFYTVETITSGPSCKCACVAPPSALNPCEGDFRLKKLREAESSDLKVGEQLQLLALWGPGALLPELFLKKPPFPNLFFPKPSPSYVPICMFDIKIKLSLRD